jgi:hypothetical protein
MLLVWQKICTIKYKLITLFMRRTYSGEFEKAVLLMVATLEGEVYGYTASQGLSSTRAGKSPSYGAQNVDPLRRERFCQIRIGRRYSRAGRAQKMPVYHFGRR